MMISNRFNDQGDDDDDNYKDRGGVAVKCLPLTSATRAQLSE